MEGNARMRVRRMPSQHVRSDLSSLNRRQSRPSDVFYASRVIFSRLLFISRLSLTADRPRSPSTGRVVRTARVVSRLPNREHTP